MTTVFFDVETSHPLKNRAVIVEIAYRVVDADFNVISAYDSIVSREDYNSDVRWIDDVSADVHGITEEMCRELGKDIVDILHDIMVDWKDAKTIVSHGIDIDIEILAMEFIRLVGHWPFVHCALVCTKELGAVACHIPRGRSGYKWPTQSELWVHCHPEREKPSRVHRATVDVDMCMESYMALCHEKRKGD